MENKTSLLDRVMIGFMSVAILASILNIYFTHKNSEPIVYTKTEVVEKVVLVASAEPCDIKQYVRQELDSAGIGSEWPMVEKLINCESNWDQWRYNINNKGTTDMGLWQINSIHKKEVPVECRFDIECSTRWAIEKRLNDGNWGAWVCAKLI